MKPVQVASAEELAALQPKQLEQCYMCKVWCSSPKVGWLDRYHTRPVCPECWDNSTSLTNPKQNGDIVKSCVWELGASSVNNG